MTSNPNKIITLQELINAQVDAYKLELIMNEAPWVEITTRLGRKCYSIATIQGIIDQFQLDTQAELQNLQDAIAQIITGVLSDTSVQTWSGRSQDEKNKDVVDIADFGGVPDNLTENKDAWDLLTNNKQNYIATLSKGNYKITPPTAIDPNLRYSYYPPYGIAGLLHLQHGTEGNPENTVGQITQVVRRVNNSSRNFNYEEQIGSALFDTKIKGTGDVNSPNLGSWVSGIFNIYKEVECESGKLDQKGSVVGLTTFAGCDYLDEDRLVTGLWARAVSPKPSDAEYDQIAGSWHTVGAEINARIRHKDTGYRENMGKGASAVLMFYNNIRPEDIASGSTVHARNNTFGLLFGGGKFAELANTIDNYNGYYTGIQLNYIKSVGIDFPNRAGSGAVGIRFAQTRTSNGSYKTAIDLGNNKFRFGDGSFGYSDADNGDIWYNGGTLYMKDSRYNTESSRFMLADNHKIVGTNTTTPTHFITVRWNSTTNFKIPAIMESV
ncbi:hypothetical protein [Acinetobacter thermotolerans]|uniref:hypothetical protein n=1 Tax=Acinetobacter thermotolerans TaxID=3151487 RepID=UPI00325AADA9